MSQFDLPFSEYILENNTNLLDNETKFSYNEKDYLKFQEKKNFDESQKAAFESAIKNKFSIIVGPPGCGKKHFFQIFNLK